MLKENNLITMGETMSKKRMMPKAVRIYYEQMKKQRLVKELAEYAKAQREYEIRIQELEQRRD